MIFNVINNVNDMGPIKCAHSVYQDFVLVWPDDDPLRPKHVAYYLIYL